jgi:hypothetical protein
VNLLAHLLLAFALISGAGGAALPGPEPTACGCCDGPAEPCPCGPATPAPASHRSPCNAPDPSPTVALAPEAREAAPEANREARPMEGLDASFGPGRSAAPPIHGTEARGRAPDLGRHLASLGTFRI